MINKTHISTARLPSFKLLTGFEAAARLGNYSRAADELYLSQSAISHQIGQLEQQIGQPLFRRKGRGVELTLAGHLLYENVVRSLDLIRGGLERIETYLDTNLVTIVCPAPIAHGWLQPRLDNLAKDHPGLCPVISVDETARYIDEMDVDIAITRQPLHQQGVHEEVFLKDALVVVCSPELAKRAANEALLNHHLHFGLLVLESDLTSETTGNVIRKTFPEFKKHALYDDPRLLLDASARGRGFALVTSLMAAELLQSGKLVKIPDYPVTGNGQVWISRIAGEPRSQLVSEVYNSLLNYAKA